ncbi:hypothetical protein W97_00930 [Coniosporium apollinis CBS 100218]|uniref:DUF7907 domain-containing protein n=1 Tax=Coniosporium apollinis (strain CBS 100218) TaxID=1168221 RepID=R7YIU6_CONA1|nr:uncharacterized protein W97_00930 [Coniosporium apollinis CBS 100218]EON61714.1 hypothetical protein W97_00930 [Coniosporium apollinis CBS 100218]
MKLTSALLALLSLLTTALALPQASPPYPGTTPAPWPTLNRTTPYFNLVTSVRNISPTNFGFTNLYLHAYHSGAGLNDAVLLADRTRAARGFLNGTYAVFNLGGPFSYGMRTGYVPYGSWGPAYLNAGTGERGFAISDGRFVRVDGNFGGWMGIVCDWWRNVPQLFMR